MRLTSFPLRRALVPFVASVALLTTTAAASSAALESCGSVITAPLASPVSADDPCPSTDPVVCRIRVLPMEEKVEAQRTRMRYHGLLEDMHRTEVNMRESGASEEEIARELVDMRNQAKEITRAGMTLEEVRILEDRNMAKYGNPLGPTADQLYAKYGSWEKVTDASMRTSYAVDRELSLEYRPCPV
ncbi:hypothetical protein ACFV2I_27010 [Streptomyces microflavus]|uniref:hypothetical protein n=1 Tax=Streptomyces TaxID=1883 RepID=UPI000B91A9D5|nr:MULTISPECIES: hypothetical protein [Streptomyces]MBK5995774.1 hypothetical protein [Streptomyces sp. MBT58]MBW3363041.1 hypothetical protein [Streptomyces sp. 09ZI22]OXY97946.1 hypothetical protein BEH93_32350 [Streptomyces sp. 2R]WSR89100.1 hypothetical protein OG728_01030 [Streptomyces microflavus]